MFDLAFDLKSLSWALLVIAGCSSAAPATEPVGGAGSAGGGAGRATAGSGNGLGGAVSSGGMPGTSGGGAAGASGRFGGSSGASGAGGAAGSGSGTATFAAVASIMSQECGKPLCHGGAAPAQMLNFTNMTTLYATLTSKVVTECKGEKLVVPGDPTNSALLKLPTWECSDPMGGPFVMPQGCIDDVCLPDAELATLRAWIAAGAPQ